MNLRLDKLDVMMGGRKVLRGISLEAGRGALMIVVGPNGAGKTTLLRAIACLLASSGGLDWDGQGLAGMSAAARAKLIAYLPQGHVAHWPITARDVVTIGRAPFATSLTRLSHADAQAIDAALDAVDARAFAERPITELSGGERARVMLARALAVGAPLLLADEPVASLDPAHQLAVMDILVAQAKSGRLVIAVSHDLILAARYADSVLVLRDGEVAAFGAPEATLTADLLRDVFNVEALELSAPGHALQIPWKAVHNPVAR
ncbi:MULTISPECIES: ABC transporter ATP-binding protein [Rhodomicrobium]|uniref:ABC transporter ATP-binding protein n=1 Tax=Rhodomicrobium TaxID=1068 RepID=UPI000B4A93F9|nr:MULTISPECIES: ABC transporter ATP-binding protein [Rhodomicrobium]